MTKQMKWVHAGTAWAKSDDTTTTVFNHEVLIQDFLKQEINDVNPLLVKMCIVTTKPKDEPTMNFNQMLYLFYPEGMKEVRHVPHIGSTNRWTFTSKEFRGDNFYLANSPQTWICSKLNNLDPGEAFYAKVTLEYQYGTPDIYTASIFIPHGE